MKKKGIPRNMKFKKKSIEQCLPLPFCETSSSRAHIQKDDWTQQAEDMAWRI